MLTFVELFSIFPLMDDFKRKIEEFFSGRHGSDQLSFAMSLAGLVLVVCSPAFENDDVHMLLSAVGLALIIWSVFRVLSRDDARRTKENEAFMSLFRRTPSPERRHKAELRRQEKEKKRRLKEKLKTHEMFYCPKCKAACFVPRGKGKVRITCPKCGEKFIGKT